MKIFIFIFSQSKIVFDAFNDLKDINQVAFWIAKIDIGAIALSGLHLMEVIYFHDQLSSISHDSVLLVID